MHQHVTRPEIPAARRPSSWPSTERNAVHRGQAAPRPRSPLASLVEEVVNKPDDPRREAS